MGERPSARPFRGSDRAADLSVGTRQRQFDAAVDRVKQPGFVGGRPLRANGFR